MAGDLVRGEPQAPPPALGIAAAAMCSGEDFARKGDLSAFVPLSIAANLRKTVPLVVELVNRPYETQRQILLYPRGLHASSAAAFDATGNGGYLAKLPGCVGVPAP